MRIVGMIRPAPSASLEKSVEECLGCLPSASKERVNSIFKQMSEPHRHLFLQYLHKYRGHVKEYLGVLGGFSQYPKNLLMELESQFNVSNVFELTDALCCYEGKLMKGVKYG